MPGRGLVLFIDLYSRLHKKYFDFIAANKALQHKVSYCVFTSRLSHIMSI